MQMHNFECIPYVELPLQIFQIFRQLPQELYILMAYSKPLYVLNISLFY